MLFLRHHRQISSSKFRVYQPNPGERGIASVSDLGDAVLALLESTAGQFAEQFIRTQPTFQRA